MLTRVAQHLAIPHISQSPVTLGCLPPEDMEQLRLFADSLAQYVSDRGCALRKRGKEDDLNPLDERVPRSLNGSQLAGVPGWLRKFDIQTINDLTTGVTDNPGAPAIWRKLPAHPHEPPWLLPLTSGPVPTGPTRLRRGMLFYNGGPNAYEYLGFQAPGDLHVRQWTPSSHSDRLSSGMILRCATQYRGRGGETVVPAALLTSSSQIIFHMSGLHGQGQTLTVESFIFRSWNRGVVLAVGPPQ
jgi:hypothetical protein